MRRLLSAACLLIASCLYAEPTVVFMTDFGVVDDSVALCKGVMYGIAPDLRIVDLTHQVTPYSILDGARFLAGAAPYFPTDAVFVTVIDPGVGSERKAIVARTKRGQYFVLPDNGLITLIDQQDPIVEAREITNSAWMIGAALSSTFHGRDIFSPVGAHIAKGEDWTAVGPVLKSEDLARLDLKSAVLEERGLTAEIIAVDGPYGNLISNIDAPLFHQLGYSIGDSVTLEIHNKKVTLPFVKTFSDVPLNRALMYVDSRGHIAFAINQGNFAKVYGLHPPVRLFIPRKK
jgi:S-adenosylmethionine hydrolase